ncbi:MAG: type II secretion system protein [Planctomycetes bacterium]|nr:type II secretion system protein [Planctomycetota bacterium]
MIRPGPSGTPARAAAGFTLIELLVVIAIIGLLAVAFAPSLFGAGRQGDETATKSRMLELVSMIEAYERTYGAFPPSDYSLLAPQKDWQFGADNGKNTGIESLVLHLSFDSRAGGTLDQHEDWLANTDGDKTPATIPLLERRERVEVVDAWGNPLAYFRAPYDGASQTIVGKLIDGNAGPDLICKPVKNPRTNGYLAPRRYQLISAGYDGVFGSEDDIVFPELPANE